MFKLYDLAEKKLNRKKNQRAENVGLQYQFEGRKYLTFKPVTLVPYEPHLINYTMMSSFHVRHMYLFSQLGKFAGMAIYFAKVFLYILFIFISLMVDI